MKAIYFNFGIQKYDCYYENTYSFRFIAVIKC